MHPRISRRQSFALGAGALGALTGASALTSCGSGSSGGNGDAISLWNFFGPDPEGTEVSTWFETLAADWNETHDVQLDLRYIPNQTYMDGTTLQTAFTSGEGPDLFVISPGDFLRFGNGGALMDLSAHVPQELRDDFTSGNLDARSEGDAIYAIPFDAEPLAMFYSVEAFEKPVSRKGTFRRPGTSSWTSLTS